MQPGQGYGMLLVPLLAICRLEGPHEDLSRCAPLAIAPACRLRRVNGEFAVDLVSRR